MLVGDLVMLVGSDGYMPPFGSIGTIIEPFDGEDYGVIFDNHICPVGEPQWYAQPSWLMLIKSSTQRRHSKSEEVTLC